MKQIKVLLRLHFKSIYWQRLTFGVVKITQKLQYPNTFWGTLSTSIWCYLMLRFATCEGERLWNEVFTFFCFLPVLLSGYFLFYFEGYVLGFPYFYFLPLLFSCPYYHQMSSPVPFSPRCVLGLRLALVGCWVFVVFFLLLYCMIGFVYLFVKTRDCSTGQQKHCPVHPS